MQDEVAPREAVAGHRVGEGRGDVLRVVEVARRPRVRHHRDRRRQVVGEVGNVEEVRAPVAELPRAVVPARAPAQADESLAVRGVLGGAEPQRPVDVRGRRRRVLQAAVPEVAVSAVGRAGHPHVRLDRPAQQAAAQDVDRMLPAGRSHPLVADLRHEARPRIGGREDRRHLGKLLHERLLPVDVLARAQRPHHDQGVVVVGRAHHHAVEAVAVAVERLAEVAAGEGVGVLRGDLRQRVRVDVAEARERHVRVPLQLVPVGACDAAAHAHLQELELPEAPAAGAARRRGGGDASEQRLRRQPAGGERGGGEHRAAVHHRRGVSRGARRRRSCRPA